MRKFIFAFFILTGFLVNTIKAQQVTVTGKVTDSRLVPVSGASVILKSTKQGTSTDSSGRFTIILSAGDLLQISAVGFTDTVIAAGSQTNISIVLSAASKTLNTVRVSSSSQNKSQPGSEISNEQFINHALEDYVNGANIAWGATVHSGVTGRSYYHVVSFGSGNTVNFGSMIPVYNPKEETHGSRYLFTPWAKGIVVNTADSIVDNNDYLYNYDKISGSLLLTEDMKNSTEIDRQLIKSFALKNEAAGYVFEKVPVIDENSFFVLLSKGINYGFYKSIKTKLVKANYQSTGLTQSGNNYDEYTDGFVYYIVDIKNKNFKTMDLKKKSIKAVFEKEKDKTDKYFTDHSNQDINEAFVKGLVSYLNEQ